jgi:hypothetical protein
VRAVNATLPAGQRFRIVLADPPIDWSEVSTFADWARVNRDTHATDVIEREVLANRRKALLVFGAMHLARRDIQVNFQRSAIGGMVVEQLERRQPGAVFNIYASPLPDAIAETAPALLRLERSSIGRQAFAKILGEAAPSRRFDPKAGRPIAPNEHVELPFADVFDAVLYMGPTVTYAEPSPLVFADEAYYLEAVRRSRVLHDTGLDQIEALRAQYLAKR